MNKLALLLLSLTAAGVASAQQADDRVLGLTTQDHNGLHIILVVASSDKARASVRSMSPGHPRDAKILDYSLTLFEELWLKAQKLDLSAFTPKNDSQDVQAAENYVLTISKSNSQSGDLIRSTYLIPKCGAEADVESLAKQIAGDLLPSGSPGLFEPCPHAPSISEG